MGKLGKFSRYYGYICIFAAVIMARMGKDIFSNYYVFRACGFVALGYLYDFFVVILKSKNNLYEYSFDYIVQSFFLSGSIGLWFLICLLYPYSDKSNRLIIYCQIFTIIIGFLFWSYKLLICKKKQLYSISFNWKNILYFLPILFVTIFLSLPSFRLQPFYDEYTYFKLSQILLGYDFSIKNEWLILCDHLSIGTNFFILPGLIISNGRIWGIRLVVFLLVILMTWSIFQICKYYLKNYSMWLSVLVSLLLVVYPTTVGTQSLNVDYFSMLLLPIVLATYLYNFRILFFVFSILLCFTKETTAILYLGFATGMIVKDYIEHTKSVVEYIKSRYAYIIYSIFPVAIWGFSFIANYFSPDLTIWGQYVNKEGEIVSQAYGHYGTSFDNIKMLLMQFFFENGTWIPLLVLVVLIIISFKYKIADKVEYVRFLPLFGAIIGDVFINCIYTTFYNYRYKSKVAFLVILLSSIISIKIISLFKNSQKKHISYNMFLVFMCMFFLFEQIYIIDPVTVYIEKDALVPSLAELKQESNNNKFGFNKIKINNALNQAFYSRPLLLEKILNDVGYDNDTLVILGGNTNDGSISLDMGYFSHFYLYYYSDAGKISLDRDNPFDEEGLVLNLASYNVDGKGNLNFYDSYQDKLDWKNVFSKIIYIDFAHQIEYSVGDFVDYFNLNDYRFMSHEKYLSWEADVYEII